MGKYKTGQRWHCKDFGKAAGHVPYGYFMIVGVFPVLQIISVKSEVTGGFFEIIVL